MFPGASFQGPSGGWEQRPDGWMQSLRTSNPYRYSKAAQVEFTVHYEPRIKGYLQVQTLSLLEPCLAVRSSARLAGPWSDSACIYQPPEKKSPGLLLYAGKAHKAFIGADLSFTYAVNTTDKDRIYDDTGIYYPKVLKGKITREKGTPMTGPLRGSIHPSQGDDIHGKGHAQTPPPCHPCAQGTAPCT